MQAQWGAPKGRAFANRGWSDEEWRTAIMRFESGDGLTATSVPLGTAQVPATPLNATIDSVPPL